MMVGETISHYKILEKLGGGGMGVVYKAEDTKLKRHVALKFLPSELTRDPDTKQRFIHEAQAASALDHPNICNIHEIGETDDGLLFIAMACYQGETLKAKIERGPIAVEEALDIAIQVAQGLERAHEAGMVHRDIKPSNIMITDRGEVKVVDFGLAKLAGQSRITKTGMAMGTVAYMSPEQTRGEEVDHRSDMWSLGVVMYEMFTGHLPFKGDYYQAVIYAILNEEPDFLAVSKSDVPKEVVYLLKKTLVKDPDDRFQSITEALNTLISARAPGAKLLPKKAPSKFLQKLTRFIRKRRVAIAIPVVFSAFLFVWYLLIRTPVSLGSNDYVLVSEIENLTNEDVFNHSLTEAFRVTLQQSSFINVLPNYRITDALVRMGLSGDHRLDEKTSVDVAKREGAPIVVVPRISKIGSNYILSSKIIDAETGEAVKLRRVEVARIEDVLSGADELAEDIRKDLGESLRTISSTSLPLEKMTTPYLQALELYSRGTLLESKGQFDEAIKLIEESLSIDTSFVMAISSLSYLYRKLGEHDKALYYHRRILPLIDRVTDRERFKILTNYYGVYFEMDYDQAYHYAKQWTLMYPTDAFGHATLGHLAMFIGNYHTALVENQRAMALDPYLEGTCYNNSGFACAMAGRADAVLDFYRKSKNIRPSYLTTDSYMARAFWMKGELDSAEAIFQSNFDNPMNTMKGRTQAFLVSFHYFKGQLQTAADEAIAGINFCREANNPGEEAYFHYLLGEIRREQGRTAESIHEMEEALRLCVSPFFEFAFVGMSYAKMGLESKALDIIAKIQSLESDDPFFTKRRSSFENFILGAVAREEQAYEEAIRCFSQVKKFHSGDPIYWMAQKEIAFCTAMVQEAEALAKYQVILDHAGEVFTSFLPASRAGGLWRSRLWTESLFELGKLHAARQDTTEAVEYLKKVMRSWEGADRDHRKANEAQAVLSALHTIR